MPPHPPPHRILILTSDLGGGTGDHVLSMIRHWHKTRWGANILSEVPITSRLTPDVPVEVVREGGVFDRYPIAQLRRLKHAARYARTVVPDIVHCYFYWSILYGRALKKLGKIQLLVENREDEGYAWGSREYAWLRRGRSMPDRVICVSEAVRQIVLEREGIDPSRTIVIHNGVEPPSGGGGDRLAARGELGVGEDEPLVGMVSNLNRPVKGVTYFLDAIPRVVEAVPSARFAIFGKGKEEADLREKARVLSIDRHVIFAGFRADIARFYPAMDISVLTSLSEGLSISLLQSMNQGLPVVVTRVGGNPEVVVDGETGFLVPPRDPVAFSEKVVRLLKDPALRERMGAAAQRRIAERFRLERTAQRYLDVYEELLRPSTGGSAPIDASPPRVS